VITTISRPPLSERLSSSKVIAVLRASHVSALAPVCDVLVEEGILSLELIPNAVHVSENDIVTTAGFKTDRLASYYPPGIPIGRVTSVSGNDTTGDTKVIQVTPFADFRNITDVLVLEPRR